LNANDFSFLQITQTREGGGSETHPNKRDRLRHGSERLRGTPEETAKFMRIVRQTLRLKSHHELFQLLQSGDLQELIPHQVFISAWGNVDGSALKVDVASAIPGMRTANVNKCRFLDALIDGLHEKWVAEGRRPLMLDSTMALTPKSAECNCAMHHFLRDEWSLIMHGIDNARDLNTSLYLAFNAGPLPPGRAGQRLLFMADHVITQLDAGFRRITPLRASNPANDYEELLSAREQEVLLLTAEGRSNAAISKTLRISAFTVKNHMQRILRKLGAKNRTEAVAKYRLLKASPLNMRR
jgi:transcriptional regulator EpsA